MVSILNIVIYVYSVAFFVMRGGELAYLLVDPTFWTAVATIAGMVWYLQLSFSLFIKVLLLAGVYLFDSYYYDFPKDFPVASAAGKTYLVTGANSGVGYYAALQLVELGATVYLACRSTRKCELAQDQINSFLAYSGKAVVADEVVGLDLSSLEVIRLYADKLKDIPLDGVLNNAGFGLLPDAPPTTDGLEVSFGSMHVGHHLLTKLLLEQRQPQDKPFRVVNVASGTHYVCMSVDCYNGKAEHFEALIQGSPDPLAYYRAKLSNVLDAYQLARISKGVTAYSVNLGFVGTNINGLVALGELRLQRQGPAGARPLVWALLVEAPKKYNGYVVHDLYGFERPLSEPNLPLYYALKVPLLAIEKFKQDDAKHPPLLPREPYTADEVDSEAAWLFERTEKLITDLKPKAAPKA